MVDHRSPVKGRSKDIPPPIVVTARLLDLIVKLKYAPARSNPAIDREGECRWHTRLV